MSYGNTHYSMEQQSGWSNECMDHTWNKSRVMNTRTLPQPHGYHSIIEEQFRWPYHQNAGHSPVPWSPAAQGLQYLSHGSFVEADRPTYGPSGHDMAYSYPSPPYHGDASSSYTTSSVSDLHTPLMASPDMACAVYTPASMSGGRALSDGEALDHSSMQFMHGGGSCVAMQTVQPYEHTEQPDAPYEEGDYNQWDTHMPQEGFVPMDDAGHSPESQGEDTDHADADITQSQDDNIDVAPPVIRRRRAATQRSNTTPRNHTRVAQRSPYHRRAASDTNRREPDTTTSEKPFPCPLAPYGCRSSFSAKNEWKRHAFTQHFRMGFWRCDQCTSTTKKTNDFNRKDLFVQHVRRMHPLFADEKAPKGSNKKKATVKTSKSDEMEEALNATAERCYRKLRDPPGRSECAFCEQVFEGKGSFDERMEHVGKHLEEAKKKGKMLPGFEEWRVDESTEQWMMESDLVVGRKGRLVLAEGTT